MVQKLSAEDARLNLILSRELKRRLVKTAAAQGKKVSALVRESIEEKLARLERIHLEAKMRQAYVDMGEENLDTVKDFKYADAENL